MPSKERLKSDLKEHLLYRGLRPLHGQLAFVHKGQVVQLAVDESLYRGRFVAVLDAGWPVREFRAKAGHYDWDAIAQAVIEVAEGRVTHGRSGSRAPVIDAANQKLANDLKSMLGPGSSQLTIEPSPATPGRVRVKLQEIELEHAGLNAIFSVHGEDLE